MLDIHQYDPTQPPASGRNLLSEVPPTFASDYQGPLEAISPRSCDHEYTTKVNQSTLSTGGSSSLFAICSKCRHHLQFTVNDSGTVGQHGHGLFDHIHHLVCRTGKASDTAPEVTFKGQRVESYYYECSYLACPTSVSVYIASPILNDGFVSLLTNDELLRKRTEEAVAAHPTRLEGVGKPLAIEVIRNLRTYIVNALRDHQHSKSITAVNKRFMSCFGVEGQPCKDLLEFLEFTYKVCGLWINILVACLTIIRMKVFGNLPILRDRHTMILVASSLMTLHMSYQSLLTSDLCPKRRVTRLSHMAIRPSIRCLLC